MCANFGRQVDQVCPNRGSWTSAGSFALEGYKTCDGLTLARDLDLHTLLANLLQNLRGTLFQFAYIHRPDGLHHLPHALISLNSCACEMQLLEQWKLIKGLPLLGAFPQVQIARFDVAMPTR
jgi:hypothetical protein